MYSIFDIFKIGIGPSSSHTVAPMKASKNFRDSLINKDIENISSIKITLYGSLAFTGKGHNIDIGLVLGLSGYEPDKITNNLISKVYKRVISNKGIKIDSNKVINFDVEQDIIFDINKKLLDNSNKMKFVAYNSLKEDIFSKTYISIGGGFIKDLNNLLCSNNNSNFPYPFSTCDEILQLCLKNKLSISDLMMKNEESIDSKNNIIDRILNIWDIMNQSINKGLRTKGVISGGLKLKRRAPQIYQELIANRNQDSLQIMDWVNLYAMAVNEENASGGRVVTAPTNGAAGVIPAVLRYYLDFTKKSNKEGIVKFFLTSGAIAILYKKNASISGAEVGCQGEVGVACSMAAGGLVAALGGSNKQIENGAEIAMEHNLGLTCDPIKGLVQIPCIERNAMGAIKAINASRISMLGNGEHKVSLDEVIKTMMQTGRDMQNIYKETSQGGLAVNVTEC